MVMRDRMLWIIESFTLGSMRYWLPHMHHLLHAVMNHLLSPQRKKNWSSFFMMKVLITPTMTKVGCEVKRIKLLLNPKAKGGESWSVTLLKNIKVV